LAKRDRRTAAPAAAPFSAQNTAERADAAVAEGMYAAQLRMPAGEDAAPMVLPSLLPWEAASHLIGASAPVVLAVKRVPRAAPGYRMGSIVPVRPQEVQSSAVDLDKAGRGSRVALSTM
jgi:hypothetical protein